MGKLCVGLLLTLALVGGLWLWAGAGRGTARAGPWPGLAGDPATAGPDQVLADVDLVAAESGSRTRMRDTLPPRSEASPGEPQLLVAGRVVDGSGSPVPRAFVLAGDLGGSRSFHGDTVRWQPSRIGPEPFWCATDERGSFELWGQLEQETFAVRAEGSDAVVVRRGARDVLLVLARPWSLKGRVLVQEPRDMDLISLRLENAVTRPGEGSRGPVQAGVQSAVFENGSLSVSEDGAFESRSLAAGTYDLVFALRPELRQLAEIPGIAVKGDVDLGTIDLRGWIHRTRVALVGAGEPGALMGQIAWRPSGSSDAWSERSFQGGEVELLSEVTPIDVRVRAGGYREGLLLKVSDRCELALGAALRVRIELRTYGELPASASLFCELRGEGRSVPRRPSFFTETNRELVFLVNAPGAQRVCWRLQRGGLIGDVLPGREVEIELLDVPEEQVFPIELDSAALNDLARDPPW